MSPEIEFKPGPNTIKFNTLKKVTQFFLFTAKDIFVGFN